MSTSVNTTTRFQLGKPFVRLLCSVIACAVASPVGSTFLVARAEEMATPDAPIISACSIEPRPLADFQQLADAPTGVMRQGLDAETTALPAPPVAGTPASSATHEQIDAILTELYACINAGDLQRVAALWSDAFLQAQLGGLPADAFGPLLTPVSLPEVDRSTYLGVTDVRVLDGGEVTAIARNNQGLTFFRFFPTDNGYLIDEMASLSGTVPATPIL